MEQETFEERRRVNTGWRAQRLIFLSDYLGQLWLVPKYVEIPQESGWKRVNRVGFWIPGESPTEQSDGSDEENEIFFKEGKVNWQRLWIACDFPEGETFTGFSNVPTTFSGEGPAFAWEGEAGEKQVFISQRFAKGREGDQGRGWLIPIKEGENSWQIPDFKRKYNPRTREESVKVLAVGLFGIGLYALWGDTNGPCGWGWVPNLGTIITRPVRKPEEIVWYSFSTEEGGLAFELFEELLRRSIKKSSFL